MKKGLRPPIGKRFVEMYATHDADHTGEVIGGTLDYWHVRLDNGRVRRSPAYSWESEVFVNIRERDLNDRIVKRGFPPLPLYKPPKVNPHWLDQMARYLVEFDDDYEPMCWQDYAISIGYDPGN